MVLFELWLPDAHQRSLLARGCTTHELQRASETQPDLTLFEQAVAQAARGALAAAEVLRAFGSLESPRSLAEILERTGS